MEKNNYPPTYSAVSNYTAASCYDGPTVPAGATSFGVYPNVPQAQESQTIIVQSPNFQGNCTSVGPNSTNVTCPSCKANVLTNVTYNATSRTHLMAFLLCIFTCCLCACVPYCMGSCKNANHYCPRCNSFIGSYNS